MRYASALIVSALAGAFAVLGFAPFGFALVPFISLALLFWLWQTVAATHRESSQSLQKLGFPKQHFYVGLAFGFGLYLAGVSWVYVSLATYGGMPLWMGLISVLGFAGLLALIIALLGMSHYYVVGSRNNVNGVALSLGDLLSHSILLACLWTTFEWSKSWVLTGFPWLDIGYAQTNTWLFGLAPIGGVYLISFVVALCSAILMLAASHRQFGVPAFVLVIVFGLAYLLNGLTWSKPVGQAINVGVVQGNVPINEKWQAQYRDNVINNMSRLSAELDKQTPLDLIVWPETGLPLYLQQTDDEFWRTIKPANSALLTGLVDAPSTGNNDVYNAAVLACDDELTLYRKRHLVPFGEYLPLRFLFDWVLDYLQLPMSDFSSWQGQQRLTCDNGINIGLSICYEDAFAAEYRAHVGDATVLVNISEDAWFGDSLAPHQRTQMAQMRARELARPLIRSSNPGPSFVLNELGKIQTISAQYEVASFAQSVQPHTGATLFKRLGNWIVWLSFIYILVYLRVRRSHDHERSRP